MSSAGHCIQCYKCESINGNNPDCELGLKKEIPYHNPCQVGSSRVKGNRCIKISGRSGNLDSDCFEPNQTNLNLFPAYDPTRMIVIRDCTDKPHNEEGYILFDKFVIRGKAYTCKHNLCNGAGALLSQLDPIKLTAFAALNVLILRSYSKVLL